MNVLILESLMSCREPMTSSRSKRNLPVNDGADISKDNVLAIGECSRHARIVVGRVAEAEIPVFSRGEGIRPTRALQRVTRGVLGQIGDSISEVRLESWISTRLPDPG
ncbi:hypothetical protein KCV06_g314, partial [Aureobasidium melanogenum]